MELLWLTYGESKKYILLLKLGTNNDKLYGLITEKITQAEADLIKSNTKLPSLSLGERIEWIKTNCPNGYTGFRTLKLSSVTIQTTYPL